MAVTVEEICPDHHEEEKKAGDAMTDTTMPAGWPCCDCCADPQTVDAFGPCTGEHTMPCPCQEGQP